MGDNLVTDGLELFAAGDYAGASRIWIRARNETPDDRQVEAYLRHVHDVAPEVLAEAEQELAGESNSSASADAQPSTESKPEPAPVGAEALGEMLPPAASQEALVPGHAVPAPAPTPAPITSASVSAVDEVEEKEQAEPAADSGADSGGELDFSDVVDKESGADPDDSMPPLSASPTVPGAPVTPIPVPVPVPIPVPISIVESGKKGKPTSERTESKTSDSSAPAAAAKGAATAATEASSAVDLSAAVTTAAEKSDEPKDPWGGDAKLGPAMEVEGSPAGLDLVAEPAAQSSSSKGSGDRKEASDSVATEIVDEENRMKELLDLDDFSGALEVAERILESDSGNEVAKAAQTRCKAQLTLMYESKIGGEVMVPKVLVPPAEVIWLDLDHRSGFLLAQVDGTSTFEEIFELSGMDRLDSLRIMAQLVQKGIVGVG